MTRRDAARSGQIVLVLAFMLVGLLILFMLHTDIFLAVRGKGRLQNAGDAAALAAARWQGVTLNLIGELNLLHLAAACEGKTNAVDGIVALQERLAIAGPIVGLLAASETARANGAPDDPGMRRIVDYAARAAAGRTGPTWPTKGDDYAAMLRAASAGGLAAGADNAALLPAVTVSGGHPLYDRAFYAAADSGNWPRICIRMFHGNHAAAVATLLSWPGWGAIPAATVSNDVANSEFFGVGVRPGFFPPDTLSTAADVLADAADRAGLGGLVSRAAIEDNDVLADDSAVWYFYDTGLWRRWTEVDPSGPYRFPLLGRVRPQYDVSGAAAACRVQDALTPLTAVGTTNTFVWTAAAKPFGDENGRRVIDALPDAPPVLPSFSFVRLIPLGGVGENNLGAADDAWLEHVRVHVPNGMRAPGCRYCRILDKWESPGYTAAGGNYLMNHAHDEVCVPPTSGDAPGGGTHHAH